MSTTEATVHKLTLATTIAASATVDRVVERIRYIPIPQTSSGRWRVLRNWVALSAAGTVVGEFVLWLQHHLLPILDHWLRSR